MTGGDAPALGLPGPSAAALLAKFPLFFLLAGSLPWAAAAHGACPLPAGLPGWGVARLQPVGVYFVHQKRWGINDCILVRSTLQQTARCAALGQSAWVLCIIEDAAVAPPHSIDAGVTIARVSSAWMAGLLWENCRRRTGRSDDTCVLRFAHDVD